MDAFYKKNRLWWFIFHFSNSLSFFFLYPSSVPTIFLIYSVDRIYHNALLGIPVYHNRNPNLRPLLLISPRSLPAPVHFFSVSTTLNLQSAARSAPSHTARSVTSPHSDGISVTSRRFLCLPPRFSDWQAAPAPSTLYCLPQLTCQRSCIHSRRHAEYWCLVCSVGLCNYVSQTGATSYQHADIIHQLIIHRLFNLSKPSY